MSNFSLGDNNAQSIAIQKARQIAAKLQLAAPNKRPNDDDDNEPRAKRFSSGSDSSMSPANLQQAQQAAAQLAARFSQPNYQQNVQPNLEAVERAKLLINKFVPQGQAGGSPNYDSNQGGGGNGGPARPGFGANSCTEMMIPGSKVGLIIGKGGLTIKQLQERTGAKMVIIQDGPNQEMEKLLKISGDPQKVEHAKQLVFELLQDKGNDQPNRSQNQRSMQDHGGAYFNAGRGNDGGGDQFEIVIPKVAVGVVIGKEGSMIKKIQSDTGCSMKILQTKGDEPGDRICTVQGTKQQVDEGKIMIEELIDSVLRRNSDGGGRGERGGNDNWSNNRSGGSNFQPQHQQNQSPSMGGVQVQQYEFSVPSNKCGIIIGRGGDTIKQINQQSGAHCEMDRNKSANQMDEKTFTIKGDQHQVEEVKRLIQDKINMDIDLQYVGTTTVNQPANKFNAQNPQSQWGASAGGGYNQGQAAQMPGPQGAPQSGQSDYSLHWIQYYRSMGMHQQADAIEAQMKAQAQTAPANPPQPQAPSPAGGAGGQDSQGDYRREWAAYYRQIGQVAEAEAIERQMKSGGPGNGNPLSFQAPGGAGNMQQQQQQYGQQYGANYQQQYQ